MLCPLNTFFLAAKRERVLRCIGKGMVKFGRITGGLRGGANFPPPHLNVCITPILLCTGEAKLSYVLFTRKAVWWMCEVGSVQRRDADISLVLQRLGHDLHTAVSTRGLG